MFMPPSNLSDNDKVGIQNEDGGSTRKGVDDMPKVM